MSSYINVHNRYTYSDLERIFNETDVLVAPSIWYETFGYTVLEALSYGVPIIISDNVGAKDILVEDAGIIIKDMNYEKLYNVFKELKISDLEMMNIKIVKYQKIMTVEEMTRMIQENCYS